VTRLLENTASYLTAALLLLAALLTFFDVIGRNVFNSPVPGSTELTELAMVGMTFLLYPQVALRQKHITVDIFDAYTGVIVRRVQQLFAGALGAALYAALGWRLWKLAVRTAGYGDVTPVLKLPLAYAYHFMSVMCWLAAAAFLATAIAAVFRSPVQAMAPSTPKGHE